MKRTAVVLALSIVLPSLVLSGLALRNASEKQIVLERQTAGLYQKHADRLAARARSLVEEQQTAFVEAVRALVAKEDPARLGRDFTARLPGRFPRARVGFAVTTGGFLLSPAATPVSRAFLADNAAFLSNRSASEIFQTVGTGEALPSETLRNVAPQESFATKGFVQKKSKLVPLSSDFTSAVSRSPSGTLARFVQNQIEIFLWYRPPEAPGLVFGAMLTASDLAELWAPERMMEEGGLPEACLVLLNERAEPVFRSIPNFSANWKLPFVATEVGEALPYWEAALYLVNPNQFSEAARSLQISLGLLIAVALGAIAWGSTLVVRETRRQMALVQKKADFVSSVSHELKSPLTSIRLFADLLQQDRVPAPEKRAEYLRIIVQEAERLTRLITNVLDFSRLERRQKELRRDVIDLYALIEETWDRECARLRSLGFSAEWERAARPYRVRADPDAIAQVLVNLFSNAEKYSPGAKEVRLRTFFENGDFCLSVSDRGLGVPAGQERAIFEPFHRAHDSLASGIGGSGLGLALAEKLAAAHDGALTFRRRDGGGSEFTLRLPCALASEGKP